MYKVMYKFDYNQTEILQVLEKKQEDWVLLKDQKLLEEIEKKFLKFQSKNLNSKGYGYVIYTANLSYLTGSFETIT